MRDGERPGYVLFLTDGLPTVGTTETADILRNVQKANEPALADLRLRRRRRRQHRAPRPDLLGPSRHVRLHRGERRTSRSPCRASTRRSPRRSCPTSPSSSRGSRRARSIRASCPTSSRAPSSSSSASTAGDGPVSVVLTGKSRPGGEALRPRKPPPDRERPVRLPAPPLGDPPHRLSPRGDPAPGPERGARRRDPPARPQVRHRHALHVVPGHGEGSG